MQKKIVFTWFFFYLFAMGIITAAAATYTIDDLVPQVENYGTVTKDVIDLSNIWLYEDDNGNNQTLPYSRNGNLTIDLENIKFKEPLLNESVKGTITTISGVSASAQYLTDTNDCPYILLYAYNTSAVTSVDARLEDTIDLTFDKDAYIVVGGEIYLNEGTDPVLMFTVVLIDVGGEDHYLQIELYNTTGTDSINLNDHGYDSDSESDDVFIAIYNVDLSDTHVFQFKIADVFTKAGLSTEILKAEKIIYRARQTAKAGSDNEIKAFFRYAFIHNKVVKINGKVLNGTTVKIDSNTIQINREIEKIANIQIPFSYIIDPQLFGDPKTHTIEFDYSFQLPDDTALTFSGVKVNFTLPSFKEFSINNVTEFYIDTEDKLSLLSGHEAGDELTVMNSVETGTLHRITLKIKYKPEHYNKIMGTGAGFFWFLTHPVNAIYVVIGTVIAVICAVLKFSKGKEKGEEIRSKGMPKQKKGLKTV